LHGGDSIAAALERFAFRHGLRGCRRKAAPKLTPEFRASSTLQAFQISSHELAASARQRVPFAPAVHIMLKCVRNVIYIDLFAITVNGLTTSTMQQSS
jgi:hypothetical protein